MSYTPGPWEIEYGNKTGYPKAIRAPKDKGVKGAVGCVVRFGGIGFPSSETGQANARLIAAAPELVEALEEALRYVSPPLNEYDMSAEAMTHGKCRALLARIKGEA